MTICEICGKHGGKAIGGIYGRVCDECFKKNYEEVMLILPKALIETIRVDVPMFLGPSLNEKVIYILRSKIIDLLKPKLEE